MLVFCEPLFSKQKEEQTNNKFFHAQIKELVETTVNIVKPKQLRHWYQITANFPKQNNITTNYLDKYKRRTQIVRFAASGNKTDHLGPPASRHMAKKTLGIIALHLEPSEPASTQSKYQGTTTIGVSVKKKQYGKYSFAMENNLY